MIDTKDFTSAAQWLEHAQQLEEQDETQQALEACEEALKLDAKSSEALLLKASLLEDLENPNEAFKVLGTACQECPDNADCWFAMGAFLTEHNNVFQAAQCFDRVNAINPNYKRIKANLGAALLKIGQLPGAIECLSAAVETSEDKVDKSRLLNRLGEAYLHTNDIDKAAESFDESLQLDDNNYVTFGNMAMVFCRRNEAESAIKFLQPALEKFPKIAKLRVALAIAYELDNGRWDDALNALNEAIELDPGDPELWFHKAHHFIRQKEMKKALKVLNEGIALFPQAGELWLHKSSLLRHLKEEKEALECHRTGLRLLNRLVLWGFFLVDKTTNKPVEDTNKAVESDRAIPRQEVAMQYLNQLKAEGHSIDQEGIIDEKYKLGMVELPLEQIIAKQQEAKKQRGKK